MAAAILRSSSYSSGNSLSATEGSPGSISERMRVTSFMPDGHRDPRHTVHYTRIVGSRFEGIWS
jgi:hypothetical protein